jgi:hypothetical protein
MNTLIPPNNWHVVVIAERPAKVDNRYQAMPDANVQVVRNALASLPPTQYAGLYHQNNTFGVDLIAEEFARLSGIRQFQFPTYWQEWDFNARAFVTDKYAGAKSSRQMLRAAKDAVYDKNTPNNQKPDYGVILLAFGNPESDELKAATDNLSRLKVNPYVVRNIPLPVAMNAVVANPTQGLVTTGSIPFGG